MEEKVLVGEGTEYPLEGSLQIPEAAVRPLPAVLFVQGSGPSDRDESVGSLSPFRDLAEGLERHGIASLRFDKRTFAHKDRVAELKNVTVKEETIEDVLLATELLRRDTRIDPARIFLLGHSLGAMLAPRIDAEGGDYHGLILLAGSPRRLEEIMLEQNMEYYSRMNKFKRLLAGKQMQLMLHAFSVLDSLTDEQAMDMRFQGNTTMYYFKDMAKHSGLEHLRQTDKPVLIMQGGKDFQVAVERDFNAYRELLRERSNVSFRLYGELNHAFVPSVYGDIVKAKQEYAVEQHIGEDVIADIADWIHESSR